MADRSDLLARLAAAVAGASPADSLSARLCEAARRLLGADGASISMETGSGSRVVLSTTDRVAAALEDLHDVLGVGPATEAHRTGEAVVLDLRRATAAWSAFAEAAGRQTGARVVLALPMRAGAVVVGVLLLHLSGETELAEPLEHAGIVADAVGAALLHDPTGAAELAGEGSWSNRAQIHQATGMVIAQLSVGVEDAVAVLRAHAFALDQSLSDVAAAVVRRELVFGKEDGGGERPFSRP